MVVNWARPTVVVSAAWTAVSSAVKKAVHLVASKAELLADQLADEKERYWAERTVGPREMQSAAATAGH